jgi:mono/diheme cytochrome c family protein
MATSNDIIDRPRGIISWVVTALLAFGGLVALPLLGMAEEVVEGSLADGQRTFDIHCSACHGFGGTGGAGPNLTDSVTMYGGDYEDILAVVTNGVSGKPMNSWSDKLPPDDLARVAAYVLSIKGTRPTSANPDDRRNLM